MSRITEAAATTHVLSIAAMEEASRVDSRTADLDHLLLALTVDGGTAGSVLRSLGVTLDAVRRAVADEHADGLDSLGVRAPTADAGAIRFHETGDYKWSDRALRLLKRVGADGERTDAVAALRALLGEPSGLIEAVLARLQVTADAITERLDLEERHPSHRTSAATWTGDISGRSEQFVPAPPENVWNLLADPARMSEWELNVEAVMDAPEHPRAGDVWSARSRTTAPDGKALSVRPHLRSQQVELVSLDPGHAIAWRFTFPDAAQTNARLVRAELEPAAGGTQVHLSSAWELPSTRRRRPIRGFLMRPLHRFAIWMQLTQLGASIGRAFR
ncbi:SRPBCC family protein [Microbacterium gorillae]|uniref:SRPBCC family protein n=1 Tax=Microbacterium gorillae TaxID=1231063 RepID=UPI0005915ACB|nr:SRPBCC domain-containing protein [Microbacterium gorillae]